MNEKRLQRLPRSVDSSRNPGSSPTMREKAATGVIRSASSSRQTGTTRWCAARRPNSCLEGRALTAPQPAKDEKKQERSPVWQAPRPSWTTLNSSVSPSQS